MSNYEAKVSGPQLVSWPAVIHGLLFGFDFFVSYCRDASTIEYAQALQRGLVERDFKCFLDSTHINPGEKLTWRIRLCLKRTRCLVVLATERALQSEWVAKEIGLFSARKRAIVPIDLEDVRTDVPWSHLDDSLFINDIFPRPSATVLDALTSGIKGWRANRVGRFALLALAVFLCSVALVVGFQAKGLRERAERLRTHAIYEIAASHEDALKSSLVLLEANRLLLPSKAADLARELASSPVPLSTLRVDNNSFVLLSFLRNENSLLSIDDSGIIREWDVRGDRDPTVLGAVPPHANVYGVLNDETGAFAATPDLFSISFFDGRRLTIESPKERKEGAEATLGRTAPLGSNWRVSDDGGIVAHLPDRDRIHFFSLRDSTKSLDAARSPLICELQGRSVLDVSIQSSGEDPAQLVSGVGLTVSGELFRYSMDRDGSVDLNIIGELPLHPSETLSLGQSADNMVFYSNERGLVGVLNEDGELKSMASFQIAKPDQAKFHRSKVEVHSWTTAGRGNVTAGLLEFDNGDAMVLDLATLLGEPAPTATRVSPPEGSKKQSLAAFTPNSRLTRSAVSPNGGTLLLKRERSAWFWFRDEGKLLRAMPEFVFEKQCRPAFNSDGTLCAVADRMGEIRVWKHQDHLTNPLNLGVNGQITSLASSRSNRIISGTADGKVQFSKIEGSEASEYPIDERSGTGKVCRVVDSGLGLGAAVFEDGLVRVYDLETRKKVDEFLAPPDDNDNSISYYAAFSNDATLTVREGNSFTYWSKAKKGRCRVQEALISRVSETGRAVSITSGRDLLCLPAPDTSKAICKVPSGQIWELSANDVGVLIGLSEGRVLYRSLDSQVEWEIKIEGEPSIFVVKLSEDNRLFVIGTDDGRVGLGTTKNAQIIRWFGAPGLEQNVNGVKYSLAHAGVVMDIVIDWRANQMITLGGVDDSCRVWSLEGQYLTELKLRAPPLQFGFLDDGRIAGLTTDGNLSVWRVTLDDVLDFLRARTTATLLPSERMRYLGESAEEALATYNSQEKNFGRTPPKQPYLEMDFWY